MEPWLWIGGGTVSLALAIGVLVVDRLRPGRQKQGAMLAATICFAIGALGLVVGWLLASEPNGSKSEAIKSGGLASGAIIALYALWLNDRRRRVEEDRRQIEQDRQKVESARQDLEKLRTERDLERVADERFARAIELLGHDADQVRVGALHALAGLARSHPPRTQTVLDVLCSYLRRPFSHPQYKTWKTNASTDDHNEDAASPMTAELRADDRERQVRLAAQRVIAETLRGAPADMACNLDLTGATLENFGLSHCRIGSLTATDADLYRDFTLDDVHFFGQVELSYCHFWGKSSFTSRFEADLVARQSHFADDAIFTFVNAEKAIDLERAVFERAALFDDSKIGNLNLELAKIGDTLGMQNVTLTSRDDRLRLPKGWRAEMDRKGYVSEVKNKSVSGWSA